MLSLAWPAGIDVVLCRAGEDLILLGGNEEASASEDLRDPGGTPVEIMDFKNDLMDLFPILAANTEKDVELALLHVDFEQIDLLDCLISDYFG